ncbi:MAG: oxidoreductase [Microbacteriaceae bacterium]|nr:oxidoreductase [Microbacteriaceae bacterium]
MSALSTLTRPTGAPSGVSVQPVDRPRRYRRRALLSDIMVMAVWASSALAASMYLFSGGAAQLSTLPDVVTGVGVVAGLVGTDFILLMLVLAARVPIIDRTVGHDRAIGLHRSLGKPALYLLLAHGALLLIGYGMASGFDPIAEIGRLWTIPDMPLAFLGLGLLVGVVISSLVAVRRRFSYEAWHLIHLLSYAAVLFALPHQLSVGGVFAASTPERVYWTALYALAFGAIGTFRFIEPAVSSLRHRMRVSSVEQLATGVFSIHLQGHSLSALGAAGGQFFIWRFWTGTTWWHSHPISLSSMPTADSARITVRDLGAGTSQLGSLPSGARVSFEGPYGVFTDAARTSPRMAVVVAGIGITPVRALLESSTLLPGEATILLRASGPDETYLWHEVQQLATEKGATLYTMIGPRSPRSPAWMSAGEADRGVTLTSAFPHLLDSDLYICGPTPWLDLVEADARAAGLSAHQLHTERFDW